MRVIYADLYQMYKGIDGHGEAVLLEGKIMAFETDHHRISDDGESDRAHRVRRYEVKWKHAQVPSVLQRNEFVRLKI